MWNVRLKARETHQAVSNGFTPPWERKPGGWPLWWDWVLACSFPMCIRGVLTRCFQSPVCRGPFSSGKNTSICCKLQQKITCLQISLLQVLWFPPPLEKVHFRSFLFDLLSSMVVWASARTCTGMKKPADSSFLKPCLWLCFHWIG
jgi:hypothetical protein